MTPELHKTLASRWQTFWSRLAPGIDGDALGRRLLDAWDEPQRAYHTQEHLLECLVLFDAARAHAEAPLAIEAALWFHDAIYDPRSGENEARCAAWAHEALTAAQVSAETIMTVEKLIIATCHAAPAETADAALLIDIDLAILGATRERFDRYDADVRREYAHVPTLAYRIGRGRILSEFLARPSIYSTPEFRKERETRARVNLRRARRRLWLPRLLS